MIDPTMFWEHVALATKTLIISSLIATAAFQFVKRWVAQLSPEMMAKGSGLLALVLAAYDLMQRGIDPYIAICACLVALQLPPALHDVGRAAGKKLNNASSKPKKKT